VTTGEKGIVREWSMDMPSGPGVRREVCENNWIKGASHGDDDNGWRDVGKQLVGSTAGDDG
jgi:hypothetical protein